MILTCPECATSYFVDELRIPRGGRMVKCTNCGARWRAFQDGREAELSPSEDDLVVEGPPAEPAPPAEEDSIVAPEPRMRRRPAPPPKPKRSPVLAIGLGVLAVLAVGTGAGILLRHQIAGAIPATAPVFAALGLPVNTLGLVIEGVASKPGFQGGRPVLSVTGAIRNVRKDAVEAPPIRVSLLDRNGKVVAGVAAQPLNAKVPPGATRYFALSLLDPPAGAHELEVAFDPAAEAVVPATPRAEAPPDVAPPAEAQPLPPGSPDALEAHD
ncbi:DUF3426 domain-containing protein [Phenylobacterium sp.]|uniref:DUF3426 domain-containing protein n=1 Tax=Phenylobacterium sp. TaxID=1871053 RepID=UPI00301D8629